MLSADVALDDRSRRPGTVAILRVIGGSKARHILLSLVPVQVLSRAAHTECNSCALMIMMLGIHPGTDQCLFFLE